MDIDEVVSALRTERDELRVRLHLLKAEARDEFEELEADGAEPVDYPAEVERLDGTRIAILGYMIPFDFGATEVTEFMLVRDLAACCFGGAARPDEWISVTMAEGGAEYVPYEPVVVIGTLEVGAFEDWTYSVGCYDMSATSVQQQL